MKKENRKLNRGFTIIEMMVALSIFLMVVGIGIGALLNANLISHKSKNLRSIMDNLSFIMEEISRNIRTGYHYQCIDDSLILGDPHSCADGWGLAFENAFGDPDLEEDQWGYYFFGDKIYKSAQGASPGTFVQLNPSEIVISDSSGFSVLGAETFPEDNQQPLVIIRLVGNINYRGIATPFSLQTTISQRVNDF